MDGGEAMKRLAEVKDSLDIDVKQNFIDPLQGLCDKDLKEIQVSQRRSTPRLHVSGSSYVPCQQEDVQVVCLTPNHLIHTPAPFEEAGRTAPGLRLQEEAPGQDS